MSSNTASSDRLHRAVTGGHALLIFCWLGTAAAASPPNSFQASGFLRPDFWDTDGTVHALTVAEGKLYLGGQFSRVAPRSSPLVAFDTYTGIAQAGFPTAIGSGVEVIIADGQGGWFVGGDFVEVGGLVRSNLVHILPGNRVDPDFRPNPNGPVAALVLREGVLYAGGSFTVIGGVDRARLAALDLAQNQVLPWIPGANDRVSALLVAGSTLYAGGYFSEVGGEPRNNLAALDISTGLVSSWTASPDGAVLALSWAEDRLIVGGFFNRIGGQERNGLAALDPITGLATGWNPNPLGGKVTALKVECSVVYVGGYFTNLAGATRARAGAVDLESGLATAWNPDLNLANTDLSASVINDLALVGNTIYIAGKFETVGGSAQANLAAVDPASGRLLPWQPEAGAAVQALATAGRTLLAGFAGSPGGVQRQNLACLDLLTGRLTDWNPGADDAVFALQVSGNTVFAGGNFSQVGSLERARLAAIDAGTGEVLPSWNPGVNDTVLALAVDGSRLFVGGQFTELGGSDRWRLAALDLASGQLLPAWVAHADGPVDALAVSGQTLYAAGDFVSMAGQTRHRLAALETSTAALQSWGTNVNHRVRALAVSGQAIYVGGEFTSVGGSPRSYLAALDPIFGLPTPWAPAADAPAHALVVSGNTLYVGGTFLHLNGAARYGCAAVTAGGTLLDWDPGRSEANRVYAMVLADQVLCLGGTAELQFEGSAARHSLVAFPQVGAPAVSSLRDLSVPIGEPASLLVEAAGQPPLFYQWYYNGAPLAGETNALLQITSAASVDSGRYAVFASNELGVATAEAMLTVLEPVFIAVQPSGQTADPGSSIVLSVTAGGHPPPIYQWRRNGVNIPGAVFPTLILGNAQPQDGGAYQVVIANSVNAVISQVAGVVVTSPELPFSDSFETAGEISGFSGIGQGDNGTATLQTGEPPHAQKPGGASLWLSWTAPAAGLATFATRGSAFDTLLAVYTGSGLTNLNTVASDEDRGGFLTSQVAFNALAGTRYFIAVDGLGGAAGAVVLGWNLDTNLTGFPTILAYPESRSVTNGATVSFSVLAAGGPAPLTYQWFFGCHAIPGATNDQLILGGVRASQVGLYRVVVGNNAGQSVESLPASLEIGPDPAVLSFDKLEDLLVRLGSGSVQPSPNLVPGGSGGSLSGALLVGFGSIVSQTFDTSGDSTSLGEPNHGGVIGGASGWLGFQTEDDGVVMVDTIGSLFDTVLAVYRPTNLAYLSSARLASDNDSAPDGIRSLVRFPASAGATYLAVVDGVNGAQGVARINWALGRAPVPDPGSTNAQELDVGAGAVLRLSGPGLVEAIPAPVYQWLFNGQNLPGAVGSNLVLQSTGPEHSGIYSLVLSNFAGSVTSLVAVVTVHPALTLEQAHWTPLGQFGLAVRGEPGQFFVLETSTNLVDWLGLLTNQLPEGQFEFVDPKTPSGTRRFYRARCQR